MRNFLAVLLAMMAGLTAVVGLVSWKVHGAIHEPEPVQQILADGEAAQDFKAAVPSALDQLEIAPTGMAVVDDLVKGAIAEATARLLGHQDFDRAWSQSLELTRSGWAEQLTELQGQLNAGETLPENSTAAQLELRFDPVASLVATMVQEAIDTAVAGIPGSAAFGVTLDTSLEARVATPIPPINLVTAQQVALADELMAMWPAILALSGLLFIMALVVASRGGRWMVWLMTGVLAALGGAAIKLAFTVMQRQLGDPAEPTAATTLLQPMLRAVQQWADPQLLVLVAASLGVALIGVLGGFISSHRARR